MFKAHKSGGSGGSHVTLFDIRLKLPYKDVLLVRGNEFEVDAIPVSGLVKLLIPCDMHVRKIKLKLQGDFGVQYATPSGTFVIERLCCLRVEWENLLTSAEGHIIFGAHEDLLEQAHVLDKKLGASRPHLHSRALSHHLPESHAVADLPKRPLFSRSLSQPMMSPSTKTPCLISGCDGTPFAGQLPTHTTFHLQRGNYILPFSVVLPANICETVEGLPPGRLLHHMSCTIERSRFDKPITTNKVIRIVRTLHPQSFSLVETIELVSAWAGKVQYSVNLDRKGIPIGSTVPIRIVMVPLKKGLSLKKIEGSLAERLHVATPKEGMLPQWERIVGLQELPTPAILEADELDQWKVDTLFTVPHRLKEITQSCCLKNGIIDVKHRLRLCIQIENEDGHVSELRAHIPVTVYISEQLGSTIGHYHEWNPHQGYTPHQKHEFELFHHRRDGEYSRPAVDSQGASSGGSNSPTSSVFAAMDAPPLYQKHIFDQLYDQSRTPALQQRREGMPSTPSGLASPNRLIETSEGYFDRPVSGLPQPPDSGPLLSPSLDVLNRIPSYDFATLQEDDEDGAIEPTPRYENTNCREESSLTTEEGVLQRTHRQQLLHHVVLTKILSRRKAHHT